MCVEVTTSTHLCLLKTLCAVLRLSSVSASTSASGGSDWGPENFKGAAEDIKGAAASLA